jgi:hypothetical protein
MFVAVILFVLSFASIVALLVLKDWELSHERLLVPQVRKRIDQEALHLKDLMAAAQLDVGKLPPLIVHAVQVTLHAAAVDFGHFAHWLGEQAHELADRVSHRHHFERRETRSEFLKKVSEGKNGNGGAGTTTV